MTTKSHRTRRFGLAMVAALSAGLVLGGTSPATGDGTLSAREPDRGALVTAEHIQRLSARGVVDLLTESGFDPAAARYGIDAYRLVYRTVDASGQPTTASGLVVLPRGATDRRLRTVSYTHGSIVNRHDAPSVKAGTADRAAAITFATAGFAAVAPDYLGLGLGPGHHPWMHADTASSAALDLLRASNTFARQHSRVLDRDVLVSGFSQGGHAAMALARDLTTGTDRFWRLGAVAPISGPYDMRGIQLPAMLSGRLDPYEATLGVAQWAVAWNRVYHLYDDPAQVFQAPYHRVVEDLFDGEHTLDEIFAELPTSPHDLLTPQFVTQLNNPTGVLANAFADNDTTCDWRPRVPVRLYTAAGDTSVLISNATQCRQTMQDKGHDVPVIDLGDIDHVTTEQHAVPDIVRWFSELR